MIEGCCKDVLVCLVSIVAHVALRLAFLNHYLNLLVLDPDCSNDTPCSPLIETPGKPR